MSAWMRAAVLVSGERGRGESRGSWHLRANGACDTVLLVAVLPEGRRAAELGRSMLMRASPTATACGLPVQRVETEVPNWVAELLFWSGNQPHDDRDRLPGPIDVPVLVDDAGEVLEVGVETLTEELQPLRREGVRLWKENEAPLAPVRTAIRLPFFLLRLARSTLREWRQGIRELRQDVAGRRPGGERPADATHPPVEGVGYEQWIQVRALLARDEVHPSHVDLYTHYRHVPWQRWAAVDAAWSERADADPALGAWAGYDFARMKPTGARWEAGY